MHVPDKQKHTHTQLRPRKEKKKESGKEGGEKKERSCILNRNASKHSHARICLCTQMLQTDIKIYVDYT